MMPEKNLVKNLVHTLSINRKASNKQIARDFGKFVRELVYQQRGGKFGENYERMETLNRCLIHEMHNIADELDAIRDYFDPSIPYNKDGKALTQFWNNIQGNGFTCHFLDVDDAAVIINNKVLQKTLNKISAKQN